MPMDREKPDGHPEARDRRGRRRGRPALVGAEDVGAAHEDGRPAVRARSSVFKTFPEAFRGRASTIRTVRGTL